MQDSTTANLIFGIDEIISYASQTSTLEAGDLILTGTPAGVGVFRDPQRLMQPGDTITIEPWRAKGFPVVKDLVVDRSAFDRIIAAGSEPGLGLLAAIFASGWLVAMIPAATAWSLARLLMIVPLTPGGLGVVEKAEQLAPAPDYLRFEPACDDVLVAGGRQHPADFDYQLPNASMPYPPVADDAVAYRAVVALVYPRPKTVQKF